MLPSSTGRRRDATEIRHAFSEYWRDSGALCLHGSPPYAIYQPYSGRRPTEQDFPHILSRFTVFDAMSVALRQTVSSGGSSATTIG